MQSINKRPRVTVRCVIAAAADVTGSPISGLMSQSRHEPLATHRACAQAAAALLTGNVERVSRGFGYRKCGLRWKTLGVVAGRHPALVQRIIARARELTLDPEAAPPVDAGVEPDMRAIIAATAQVTGSTVKDIMSHGRMRPWETYYQCLLAVTRRFRISPVVAARALGRCSKSVVGRPGRFARIEAAHGPLIDRIAARAVELARLPDADLDTISRAPVVAVPFVGGHTVTARNRGLIHA